MTDLSTIVGADVTVADLVDAMKRSKADLAHLVVHSEGRATGAVILVSGEITQAILGAVCQRERELQVMRGAKWD